MSRWQSCGWLLKPRARFGARPEPSSGLRMTSHSSTQPFDLNGDENRGDQIVERVQQNCQRRAPAALTQPAKAQPHREDANDAEPVVLLMQHGPESRGQDDRARDAEP